jgi:hypothetical protein
MIGMSDFIGYKSAVLVHNARLLTDANNALVIAMVWIDMVDRLVDNV